MTGTCGPIRSESLARWDQASSCWRTCQASLWEVMDGHHMGAPWSESWPRSGMTRNGELYPLPTLAPHTSGRDGGLWRTPDTADATDRTFRVNSRHEPMLSGQVKLFSTPPLALAARMWNTPNTMDALSAKSQQALDHEHETARPGRSNPNNLRDQVSVSEGQTMWPTPKSRDWKGGMGTDPDRQLNDLDKLVKLFPTPTRGDWKGGRTLDSNGNNVSQTSGTSWGKDLSQVVSKHTFPRPTGDEASGSLSPDWVSWLMGLPVGWTSLEPMPRREYLDWLHAQLDGTWWQEERGLPRVATGVKDRVNRLKCLGNGIVPAALALFLRR